MKIDKLYRQIKINRNLEVNRNKSKFNFMHKN